MHSIGPPERVAIMITTPGPSRTNRFLDPPGSPDTGLETVVRLTLWPGECNRSLLLLAEAAGTKGPVVTDANWKQEQVTRKSNAEPNRPLDATAVKEGGSVGRLDSRVVRLRYIAPPILLAVQARRYYLTSRSCARLGKPYPLSRPSYVISTVRFVIICASQSVRQLNQSINQASKHQLIQGHFQGEGTNKNTFADALG